jgi:hypothetical protein
VRDQNATQILTERLLDKVRAHLLRRSD